MTDTPETQPVEAAEILKLLRKLDTRLTQLGSKVDDIEAAQVHGYNLLAEELKRQAEQLGNLSGKADETILALRNSHAVVVEVAGVVREAAPLLNSGPARALKSGKTVLGYLKSSRGDG